MADRGILRCAHRPTTYDPQSEIKWKNARSLQRGGAGSKHELCDLPVENQVQFSEQLVAEILV